MPLTTAEWQALRLSLLVALAAAAASLPLAIVIAWFLAKKRFAGKFLVETLINLPLVLPPVVTGYLLLCAFGRRGLLGGFLERTLGLRFVFDWKGAALAAAIVSFPLMVRPIRLAFAAVDDRLLQAARTLGAGPFDAFLSVALPLARPGVLSGVILSWARSMGEFGATIMIAGNIPGETRTVPLMIYSLLESPDGLQASRRLVVASIVIAAAALAAGEWLDRRGQRRLDGASAPMSVLCFDCRFRYASGFALNFAFEAAQGVTALVGPSGSGKTTVLNLIAGLLVPQSGVITLGGEALFDGAKSTNLPPERRGIGYVFQDFQLFPHLSVQDNLRYGQRRAPHDAATLDKIASILDLGELLQRMPASLSGGQKQRVALRRALLRGPRLLLLDEPLNALDLDLRRSISTYLSRVIDDFRIPSVLVSHDQESVASLANASFTLPSERAAT